MAVCPVNALLLQPHIHSVLTHTHARPHILSYFLNFNSRQELHSRLCVSEAAAVTGSGYFVPQTLTTYQAGSWPAGDLCLSLSWPVPTEGNMPLTPSSGRCYYDIRKSPQLTCPSTSHTLKEALPPLLSRTDKKVFTALQHPLTLSAREEKTQEKEGLR